MKSGSHDDVFNPDKAGLKSPGSETGSKGEAADGRAGLEDSYYEDCGPEVARYLPGERYVDVKHSRNLEGESAKYFACPEILISRLMSHFSCFGIVIGPHLGCWHKNWLLLPAGLAY